MIYYFSGTGNSRYIAEQLADKMTDRATFIPTADFNGYTDVIGFVFPIYSWGVPPIVLDFIESLPHCENRNIYSYMVATCGDDIGLSTEMLRDALTKKGITLNAAFSIQMPNTYVLLPGFDVDSTEVENKKLKAAELRINEIANMLNNRKEVIDVTKGSIPWLKTKVVYPLFTKYGIDTKKWHTTIDCTGCGMCSKICPVSNISIVDGHPKWGKQCVSCTACYHTCPHNAIKYGNLTTKKGQYRTLIKKSFK